MKAFTSTVYHFFGGWQAIFGNITAPRNPDLSTYTLVELMFTGVLMFLFRLEARRQINYKIVLQDDDLVNIHRSFKVAWACEKENHTRRVPLWGKRIRLGQQLEIIQEYRWANWIDYVDSEDRTHYPNVLECVETKPSSTGKHMWLTNFSITIRNVDTLANNGGR